jgi:hypothetical protein
MISKQTTLDLNGPILSFTQNPVGVGIITNGSNVTFSGIATVTYPTQVPSNPVEGTGSIVYQWYDKNGQLSNGARANSDGSSTTYNGVGTTTLSIANAKYLEDNLNEYYLSADYIPSAYGLVGVAVTVGSARSTGNAVNESFFSNRITLDIYTTITIVLQPSEILDGSSETFSTFNINATTLNPQEDNLLSYQWRINGNNLSDNADVSGSRTKQLIIKQPVGTYTIDCQISHPKAFPSTIISNSVSYVAKDPRQIIAIEEIDLSTEQVLTNFSNLNSGPINLLGRPSQFGGTIPASTVKFLYAPEKDLDVVIEMAGAGGQSFSGVQAGQGGWGVFRMTLKKNVEYSIKLGSSGASYDPFGGRISGTPIRGGGGGGAAFLYEKNRLIAVLGGGGGAGAAAAGGDGGGFNIAGEKGFGRSGGVGGSGGPSGSGQDRFTADVNGGTAGICPIGGLGGTNYFRNIGISDCSDYTSSGHFTTADTGKVFSQTALLNRGWRTGIAGRLNGGWGINGAGGAGGGGAKGGNGSDGNSAAGGGGSGYADLGRMQVLNTLSGVNTGDAYMLIKLYNPADPIPNPTVSAPPNAVTVRWNDTREPGYKYGDEFGPVGGNEQTVPGQFIQGPSGSLSSPPFNYATSFTNYRTGPQSPAGIFFTPNDSSTRDSNISYMRFRLRIRQFGPRSGDTYLTSNRGNRDPSRGNVRKWYTTSQSTVDSNPDLYTRDDREAFVPFRVNFTLKFICGGNGNYRNLTMQKSQDWSYFDRYDIEFDSNELAQQNGLSGGTYGGIEFPDFYLKTYEYLRISNIDTEIINLDLNVGAPGRINGINMFATGITDVNQIRSGNFLEFGKYIIT